jgi:GNAT superfamily N-acetyltransferase
VPAVVIEVLTAADVVREVPALVTLLQDAVDDGASVGFLPPLGETEASEYWHDAAEAVEKGSRVVLVARDTVGRLVGTVQLDLAMRANGLHRAEVAKLMVLRVARRRGVSRALMLAVEEEGRRRGRTTLVLDTRAGDPSEQLYASLGYRRAGEIPAYARSANGTLHATALYYRLLAGPRVT